MSDVYGDGGSDELIGGDPTDPLNAAIARANSLARATAGPRLAPKPPSPKPAAPTVRSSASATAAPPPKPAGGGIMGAIKNGVSSAIDWATDPRKVASAQAGEMAGITRAPGLLAGQLFDTAADVGIWLGQKARPVVERIKPLDDAAQKFWSSPTGEAVWNVMGHKPHAADVLSMRSSLGQVGNTSVNNTSAELASFAIGFGATGMVAKAAKLPEAVQAGRAALGLGQASRAGALALHLAGDAGKAGVMGYIVDPDTERVSNVLKAAGVHTEFTDWLAHDDKDGRLESRFKSAVENAGLGLGVDGLFAAAKYVRLAARGGKPAELAKLAEQARAAVPIPEGVSIEPPALVDGTPEAAAHDNMDAAFANHRGAYAEADAMSAQQAAEQEASASVEAAHPSPPLEDPLTGAQAEPEANGGAVPDTAGGEASEAQGSDAANAAGAKGAEEPPTDEVLAQGTRHTDTPPPAEGTAEKPISATPEELHLAARAKISQDANAALEKSGVTERTAVGDLDVDRAGKVVVSPFAFRKLQESNLSAGFTTPKNAMREGVPVFAEREKISQKIGVLNPEGVKQFYQDAADSAHLQGTVGAEGMNVKAPGDPLAGPKGEHHLSNIGEADDLPSVLRTLVERMPNKGVRSDAQVLGLVKQLSDEIGADHTMALDFARKVAGQVGNLDSAVQVIRTWWGRAAGDIDRLAIRDWSNASDDEVEDAAKAVWRAQQFTALKGQVSTSLGRSLRQFKLQDLDSYLASMRRGDIAPVADGISAGIRPLPTNKAELRQFMELWQMQGTLKQKANFLKDAMTLPSALKYLRTSMPNLFTANILSGPRTILLNGIAPAIVSAVRTFEKTTGPALALQFVKDPARRAELLAVSQNAAAAHLAAMSQFRDVIDMGVQAFKQNRRILGGGSVIDTTQQMGPITDLHFQAANATPSATQRAAYAVGNAINLWPRAFQRINNSVDEMAVRLSYIGTVRANAMVEGAGKGLHGDELKAFIDEAARNSTDELGAATDKYVLRQAERSTMTGSVQADGGLMGKVANLVNTMRSNVPESRYIVPIFGAPVNGMGETLRRIPGVNLLLKESREELLGNRGAVAQAEAYGRMITGTAILGTAFGLARMGQLTGSGPQDPALRKEWLQTHQPYSIRIGHEWVSYQKIDVVGSLLGIPATLYDRSVYHAQDQSFGDQVLAAGGAMMQYLKDGASLRNVSDVLNAGASPATQAAPLVNRTVDQVLTRLVVPNFVTQLMRNPTDPVMRGHADLADTFWDALPFTSKRVDPLRNSFGELIHKPQDTLQENILPFTFAPAVDYADDPELDELNRLYEKTGKADGLGPLPIGSVLSGGVDPRLVQLEDGHSLYEHVNRLRGTITNDDGQTLRQAIQQLFASDEYRTGAVDADSSNLEVDTPQGKMKSRAALASKVFEDFTKRAKRQTVIDSPTALRYITGANIKRTGSAAVSALPLQKLADPTSRQLIENLGVNYQDHVDTVTGDH